MNLSSDSVSISHGGQLMICFLSQNRVLYGNICPASVSIVPLRQITTQTSRCNSPLQLLVCADVDLCASPHAPYDDLSIEVSATCCSGVLH